MSLEAKPLPQNLETFLRKQLIIEIDFSLPHFSDLFIIRLIKEEVIFPL